MRLIRSLRDRWNGLSLALQYGIAGGVVLACAMVLIGFWVTRVIEDGIKSNAASATALYVDSVIAPLLPELREDKPLDAGVPRALDEVLSQGALGDRLASFKIWRRDGHVLYALDPRNHRPEISADRRLAARPGPATWLPSSTSLATSKARGSAPRTCRCSKSTARSANRGRARSWRWPSSTRSPPRSTRTCGRRGSRAGWSWRRSRRPRWRCCRASCSAAAAPSSASAQALTERVAELSALLAQNRTLRQRVQKASRRASAINERYLRRIGADLHDGPAQLVALAALRMDSEALVNRNADGRRPTQGNRRDTIEPRRGNGGNPQHLQRPGAAAHRDCRSRCHRRTGDRRARAAHREPRSTRPGRDRCGGAVRAGEDLHFPLRAGDAEQCLSACRRQGTRPSSVGTAGRPAHGRGVRQRTGFDPQAIRADGLGLAGLKERVESIGGHFAVQSSPAGTRASITLNVEEVEHA